MDLSKNDLIVIDGIKKYSKVFIEEMGGFYPFAIALQMNKQIISIAASDGNEYTDAQCLIDLLKKSIPQDIGKKKYLMAAICIDIFVKELIDNVEMRKNAIEIHLIYNACQKKILLFYEVENKTAIFREMVGWN